MGSKKTTSKQTNKPVYSAQIEGAAGAQNAAYARQQPVIGEYADKLTGVSDGLLERYNQGDPVMSAAQGYITDTLAGDGQSNPQLQSMIDMTNDSTRRQLQTQLGTRGGIGGSAELDIVGRALAQNETGLRYNDYSRMQQQRAQAAGMAPAITAGSLLPLDAAMKTGQAGAMLPLQASALNAGTVGGLLGQYQDVEGEQKQKMGFMDWAGLGLQGAGLFSKPLGLG